MPQLLNLDFAFVAQGGLDVLEVRIRSHCYEVAAVDHNRYVELGMSEKAWVHLALLVYSRSEGVAVLQRPVESGIAGAENAHRQFSASAVVARGHVLLR